MSIQVHGFAHSLARRLDFDSVSVDDLDRVLVAGAKTL